MIGYVDSLKLIKLYVYQNSNAILKCKCIFTKMKQYNVCIVYFWRIHMLVWYHCICHCTCDNCDIFVMFQYVHSLYHVCLMFVIAVISMSHHWPQQNGNSLFVLTRKCRVSEYCDHLVLLVRFRVVC